MLLEQINELSMAATEHAHETDVMTKALVEKITEASEAAESIGALATVAGTASMLDKANQVVYLLEQAETLLGEITTEAQGLIG